MKQDIRILKTITVAVIIFIMLLFFALMINFVRLYQISSAEEELKEKIATKQEQISLNNEDIEYKSSDEYIERYNREYLHRMKKGEKSYTG